MNQRFRRIVGGVGLVTTLALFATPAAMAAPVRTGRQTVRVQSIGAGWRFFVAVWQAAVGNPTSPNPAQGPTVDPNGKLIH